MNKGNAVLLGHLEVAVAALSLRAATVQQELRLLALRTERERAKQSPGKPRATKRRKR